MRRLKIAKLVCIRQELLFYKIVVAFVHILDEVNTIKNAAEKKAKKFLETISTSFHHECLQSCIHSIEQLGMYFEIAC